MGKYPKIGKIKICGDCGDRITGQNKEKQKVCTSGGCDIYRNPTAGVSNPTAGVSNPTAGVSNPTAGVSNPTAGVSNPIQDWARAFAVMMAQNNLGAGTSVEEYQTYLLEMEGRAIQAIQSANEAASLQAANEVAASPRGVNAQPASPQAEEEKVFGLHASNEEAVILQAVGPQAAIEEAAVSLQAVGPQAAIEEAAVSLQAVGPWAGDKEDVGALAGNEDAAEV